MTICELVPQTPDQVLDGAADYIHEHGWCRGEMKDSEGRACLWGALREACIRPPGVSHFEGASGASGAHGKAGEALLAATKAEEVARRGRTNGGWVGPAWNDYVCRDADEAIGMLKKAKEYL